MRSALNRWSIPIGILAGVVAGVCVYWPSKQHLVQGNSDGDKQSLARVSEAKVQIVQSPSTIRQFGLSAPNGWSLYCFPDGSGLISYGAGPGPSMQFKAGTIDFATAVRKLRETSTDVDGIGSDFVGCFYLEGDAEHKVFGINDSSFALALFENTVQKEVRESNYRGFAEDWKKKPAGWYEEFTIQTPQTPNYWWFRCERDGSGWVSYAGSGTRFREGTIDFPAVAKRLLKLMTVDNEARNGFRVMVNVGGVRRNGFITDAKFILPLFEKAARKEVSTDRKEYFDKFWKENPPSLSRD